MDCMNCETERVSDNNLSFPLLFQVCWSSVTSGTATAAATGLECYELCYSGFRVEIAFMLTFVTLLCYDVVVGGHPSVWTVNRDRMVLSIVSAGSLVLPDNNVTRNYSY